MYIEFHDTLRDELKVHRLAKYLSVPYAQALGHLSCLWLWTANHSGESGSLVSFSPDEIAQGGKWEGEQGVFIDALKKANLVDENMAIHNWCLYGIRLLLGNRQRVRKSRNVMLQKRYSNSVTRKKVSKKESKSLSIKKGVVKGETSLQQIVNRYLELNGTPRESLTQTQVSGAYRRHGLSAKRLLEEADGADHALNALEVAAAYFIKKGLTWTLDTVAKHLPKLEGYRRELLAERSGLNRHQLDQLSKLASWYKSKTQSGSSDTQHRVITQGVSDVPA